uniref:NADH dehydrogenase subunit 6 n=1 Tax=Timema cristinae TaxID=61476 RepID=A0A7R9HA92_TIMCR|nr:unnamed protein product [Timema cristinae]
MILHVVVLACFLACVSASSNFTTYEGTAFYNLFVLYAYMSITIMVLRIRKLIFGGDVPAFTWMEIEIPPNRD